MGHVQSANMYRIFFETTAFNQYVGEWDTFTVMTREREREREREARDVRFSGRRFTGTAVGVLESYWPPPSQDDHQNVDSMVKGMVVLACLEGLSIADLKVDVEARFKPGLAARLRELQPLAIIARCWAFLFTNHEASLSKHVVNLAELAAVSV